VRGLGKAASCNCSGSKQHCGKGPSHATVCFPKRRRPGCQRPPSRNHSTPQQTHRMPRSSRGMTKKERRCRVHWALVTFVRVAGAGDAGQAGRSCMRAGTSPAPVAAGGADAEPKLTAVNFSLALSRRAADVSSRIDMPDRAKPSKDRSGLHRCGRVPLPDLVS